ncbi:hypothetical protein C1H46_035272 [Malus baccata]|uniref:Uncharacterized protein n=1 Tax=Malus baccata TaxID=106549 RepID=A0A540KYC5_MALBA|nr:hypothetical protein C1H46_035272 [Malus baccata]
MEVENQQGKREDGCNWEFSNGGLRSDRSEARRRKKRPETDGKGGKEGRRKEGKKKNEGLPPTLTISKAGG